MAKCWLVLSCALALGAAGCGDSGGEAGDLGGGADAGGGGASEAPVEETITADEGGRVQTEGGGAEVEIPAGALAEDTEITIDVVPAKGQPDADRIIAPVYDFGPDGATFETPVTLRIELDQSKVPDGMKPVMAWLDEDKGEWQPLADSAVEGGAVTASTDHFTLFTIIVTSAGQTAGSCDDIAFEPCGGDIVGSWAFTLGCGDLPADFLGPDSPFAMCDGFSAALAIDLEGTITFEEGGSYSMDQTVDVSVVMSVPKTCLMNMPCDALGDDPPAVDKGETCELTQASTQANMESGSFEVAGDTFTTTHVDSETMEETTSDPVEYCVSGDTLLARAPDDMGGQIIFQATRQ